MDKSLVIAVMIGTLAAIGASQDTRSSREVASLVEAERTFARTSVEKGMRASFTEFFADDGLNFRPHPINVKEDYRKRPAPPGPQTFTLNWEPMYADVSQAADLGYTTGPVVISYKSPANKPPMYAYYFSVWKKQSDGSWKVLLDFGTDTPESVDVTKDVSLQTGSPTKWKGRNTDLESERLGLLKLEKDLSTASVKSGIVEAYRDYLMDSARLHRDNFVPLVGKNGILQFLTENKVKPFLTDALNAGISSSADLGYTYGKYQQVDKVSPTTILEQGYFLRVWKRDASGKWRIGADIATPVPKA